MNEKDEVDQEKNITIINGKKYEMIICDRYSFNGGAPVLDMAGYAPTFTIRIPSPYPGGEILEMGKMVVYKEIVK